MPERAACTSSDIRCRRPRPPRSGTSALPRRTCGFTTTATLDWHMRFIRSIFPSWDQDLRADAAQTVRPQTGAENQKPVARPACQSQCCCSSLRGDRGCWCSMNRPPASIPWPATRFCESSRRSWRRAAQHPVLIAQHAGRRADLRSDHVHRPRPDHRLPRQGDLSRSLAAHSAWSCRPASSFRRFLASSTSSRPAGSAVATTNAYHAGAAVRL